MKKKYLWKNILAALVPTLIIGFLLHKIIEKVLLGNSMVTVVSLILGGFLILWFERLFTKKEFPLTGKTLPLSSALCIGIGQAIAVIPGVSRSAATIFTGMFLKLNREDSVEFSFLLAVPTITAAAGFDLLKSSFAFSSNEILLLVIGCIGSFISALIAIRFFLSFLKHHSFTAFGWYRIILGILFWFFVLR